MVGEEGFGTILKRHRTKLGLKQKELAQAVNMSPSYISKLEREDRAPPPHTAELLASYFKLEGEERRSFLEAARRLRAKHLESRGLKAPARLLARVPPLPQRVRSPIGRDKEIKGIFGQLAEPGVIINITGDPAIGKTTVALEVAHRYWDQERVVLWGDAREGTAESVAQVEALIWNSIVGEPMPDSEAQKEKRLLAAVSKYKPLVVLDNLESAKEFAEILNFAKQIGKATPVLITSRRWIPPAHIGDNVSLSELSEHEGIRLFEKVGEAYGRQAAVEKDHLAIEIICTDFLAGHPGAIEIAASLWKGWPLVDILRGLKQRAMETLEDPHRTDINRSMRLSIGLSYDLLHQENLKAWELFPRLSVFQASFSHRAVESVAGMTEVLPALEFLVDRSLVRFDGRRHSLHSVVREFGLEKLKGARGEYELRAAQYFLDFAGEHESDFDRLDEEKGNFFATIDWAEAHEEHRRIALELSEGLRDFMYSRGLWAEKLRRMQRALEVAELIGEKTEIMHSRYSLAEAYRLLADKKHARRLIEDALALAREIGDSRYIGLGLLILAQHEIDAQNYLRARELGIQGIGFLEQTGVTSQLCPAFSTIGRCEQALGNLDEAYSYFEKALALARQLEDPSRISSILRFLFQLDIETLNLASAEERAREHEELAELTNDPFLKGESLSMWADLLQETSGPEAAKRYLLAAVSHFEKVGLLADAIVERERLVEVAKQLNDLSLEERQLTAIASALSAFGTDKRAAFAFYRLGLVQEELNKPRDAEASYEEALLLYSSLGMLDDPTAEEIAVRLERIRTQPTRSEE